MKRRAYTLIELLLVAAIFSILGLLVARITEGFVQAYIRARDHIDLQNIGSSLIKDISEGDSLYFDGLKGAAEIIEANDKEISFVPQYRESSQKASAYLGKIFDDVEVFGPPRGDDGKPSGGLRIAYDSSSGECELRYYLSKQPRAGSSAPQVYLKNDSELSGIEGSWNLIPVRYVWSTPADLRTPVSYVVFRGGFSTLVFENKGTPALPRCPGTGEIAQVMQTNEGQLFPDPFNRPGDEIIVYYHPETDPGIIDDQENLAAHLFLKDAYPDQPIRFGFEGTELERIFNIKDENDPQSLHTNSLVLFYDSEFQRLPLQSSLLSANLKRERLQFLAKAPEESTLRPTTFSYFSTQKSTEPLAMELIAGRNQIPPELINNIGLIRFDFLMMIGADAEVIAAEEITHRNHTQLIALDNLRFTTNLHTHSFGIYSGPGNETLNSRRGFSSSNCLAPGGNEGGNKCRQISSQFPRGDLINLSQTFYLEQFEKDTDSQLNKTGFINIILEHQQRVYKVKIDFSKRRIIVMKKSSYTASEASFDGQSDICPEAPFPEGTTCFAIDDSDHVSLTNLQGSAFLDDGFHYSDKEIWLDHLKMDQDDDTAAFYIEVSDDSNIEGFSLTYVPR